MTVFPPPNEFMNMAHSNRTTNFPINIDDIGREKNHSSDVCSL